MARRWLKILRQAKQQPFNLFRSTFGEVILQDVCGKSEDTIVNLLLQDIEANQLLQPSIYFGEHSPVDSGMAKADHQLNRTNASRSQFRYQCLSLLYPDAEFIQRRHIFVVLFFLFLEHPQSRRQTNIVKPRQAGNSLVLCGYSLFLWR